MIKIVKFTSRNICCWIKFRSVISGR